MCKSFILHLVGGMVLEKSCRFIVPVQAVEGPYPDIAKIILAAGSDKIGRYAMRVLWVVSQVLDISVCFHSEESLFPASDPQFACIVLVNTGDISFLDGVS